MALETDPNVIVLDVLPPEGVLRFRKVGDTQDRVAIMADGSVKAGSGAAAATEVYSGLEIGHAESAVLVTSSSVGGENIASLSVTVPAGTRPLAVDYGGTAYSDTEGGSTILLLAVDGAAVQSGMFVSPTANGLGTVVRRHRLAASASSRVLTLQIAASGGVAHLQGQVATQQTYIHVVAC